MFKRVVIAVVLAGLLLAPAPRADASRCHIGGSGKKTIACVPAPTGATRARR